MNGSQVAITIVVLLLMGGAAVAAFALDGGGGSTPAVQAPTATLSPSLAPASPQGSATAVSSAMEAETPAPDRTSCDEIRGTPYRSDSERDFFLSNCTSQPSSTAQQPSINLPESSPEPAESCETSIEIATTRSDETYDVTGTDIDEIAASLEANAPQIEGETAFGLTEYSYGLNGSFCVSASNACSLGTITISATVTVTLPHLTTYAQLSPSLAQVWDDYAEQVAIHEGRHVRILEEGLDEIRSQLLLIGEEANCDALDHEIDKVWTLGGGQIEQRQRAFHAADASGSGGLVVQ